MKNLFSVGKSFSVVFFFFAVLASVSFAQAGYCVDNDEVDSVYVEGTVAVVESFGISYFDDACVGTGSVREYSCSSQITSGIGTYVTETRPCPSGYACSSGACRRQETSSSTCTDSDNGRDANVKGYVSTSSGASIDSCVDLNTVKEYYCFVGMSASSEVDCASGYECKNGACVEQASRCSETDGGLDVNTAGTTTGSSGSSPDVCLDSDTVTEFYCLNLGSLSTKQSLNKDCPSGYACSGGACVVQEQPAETCTDSDGGTVYTVKGTMVYGGRTSTDSCENGTRVTEYYCDTRRGSPGVGKYSIMNCPAGNVCKDGACVAGTTSSATCRDSDNGEDIYTFGTTTRYNADGSVLSSVGDSCLPSGKLDERTCLQDGAFYSVEKTCPSNYLCDGGKCVVSTPTPTTSACTESGDSGLDVRVKGAVSYEGKTQTDYCQSNGVLKEFYCSEGRLVASDQSCSSGYVCSDGACVVQQSGSTGDSLGCTDSDNGIDVYTFGSTKNKMEVARDLCISATTLNEYYCREGKVVAIEQECSSGYVCSDGACVVSTPTQTTSACTDSDKGINVLVTGTTRTNIAESRDSCVDLITVKEYYCDGGAISDVAQPCPPDSECSDGKCVAVSTPAPATSTCSDSDGGVVIAVQGTTVKESDSSTDSCVDAYGNNVASSNKVREFYCDTRMVRRGGGVAKKHVDRSCGQGQVCVDGACVVPQPSPTSTVSFPTCFDSDGGNNVLAKGVLQVATPYSGRQTIEEYCIDAEGSVQDVSDYVEEFVCLIGHDIYAYEHWRTKCDENYPCKDGACSGQSSTSTGTSSGGSGQPTETVSCVDSDSGTDIYTAGTVSYNNEVFADECVDESLLREFYCGTQKNVRRTDRNCPDDFFCKAGACVKFVEQPVCRETDGGDDVSKKGKTAYGQETGEDYCLGEDSLLEYFCAKTDDGVAIRKDKRACAQGFVCKDGACVSPSSEGKRVCRDTDKGDDKSLKGETAIYVEKTILESKTDYCYSDTQVAEYYCSGDSIQAKHEACMDGNKCVDGACVSSTTPPVDVTSLELPVKFSSGWNMFSVPFDGVSVESDCENFEASRAWTYDAGQKNYVRPSSFEPGAGYWFKSTKACVVKISGRKAFEINGKKLYSGWNQVGSQTRNVNFRKLVGDCSFSKGPWEWNAASRNWQKAAEMQPGEAYFVKAESECTLGGEEIPPLPE